MVFRRRLSDSMSPQVSRTLLSILADLNNAVVWMVSTPPLISKSSSLCTNFLVTVSSAPITIGITITCMFHSFFSSLARSRYLSLFSLSFCFTMWSAGTAKSTIRQALCFFFFFFFFFYWLSLDLVVWPRLDYPFVFQNTREFYAFHFPGRILGCAYTICSYYYYYYYSLIRDFHISVSRWFFTGVWVTASLLKSPELFLIFWPFSIMLSFGWSPLVRQLPSPLVPLAIL